MATEKFESIYRDIKEKIETGNYQEGTLLPSEHQLTDKYSCSRNTVRRALAMLANDGYVQAIHGKGVQIIYAPVSQAAFAVGGIESFAESAKKNELNATTRVVRFIDMIVDEKISARTGFPVGTPVFYIQRVRYLDEKPVIFDNNIFLRSEMPELTEEIAAGSVYQYLEEELHMQIVTSNRRITSERATEMDSELLALKDYDFVSVVTSKTYNDKGIMFEWTQSRHRPDYFVFYDSATRKKQS